MFVPARMTPVPIEGDEKCERDLEELESLGFRRELLPSRNHTESIVNRLSESQLEIAKRFALKYCAVRKRRGMALIPRIERLDRSAIIEAWRLHSSRPLYLCWKNPEVE